MNMSNELTKEKLAAATANAKLKDMLDRSGKGDLFGSGKAASSGSGGGLRRGDSLPKPTTGRQRRGQGQG